MGTSLNKRKKLDLETKLYLTELLQQILWDPEYFLELKENVKKRLQSFRRKKGKVISLAKIKEKYLNK